eukprot:3063580-Prymnesium_polylepis.1
MALAHLARRFVRWSVAVRRSARSWRVRRVEARCLRDPSLKRNLQVPHDAAATIYEVSAHADPTCVIVIDCQASDMRPAR